MYKCAVSTIMWMSNECILKDSTEFAVTDMFIYLFLLFNVVFVEAAPNE